MGQVLGVEGDRHLTQSTTPHPTLTMEAGLPRLCGEVGWGDGVRYAWVAPSSGPLPMYDDKLAGEEKGVNSMWETDSGDSDAGEITRMSCFGRSDKGHWAATHYQVTTYDPPFGLIVGQAPDQTL